MTKNNYTTILSVDDIYKEPKSQVNYTAKKFGINLSEELKGYNTKICFIDSGKPYHPEFNNIEESINFSTSTISDDVVGHSTVLAGIVGAKGKFITGIAPLTKMYFAKSVNDEGIAGYDSVIASILWAITRDVDVIVIPMGIEEDNYTLKETIQKAIENNICVISTSIPEIISYPANYKEVFKSCGTKTKTGKCKILPSGEFQFPSKNFVSTYIDEIYATVNGNSISTALLAGICLNTIEEIKLQNNGRKIAPNIIHKTIISKVNPTKI